MKKLLKSTLTLSIICIIWSSLCLAKLFWNGETEVANDFPYPDESLEYLECDQYTDLWNCTVIKPEKIGGWDTIIIRLLWQFWLDTSGDRDLKLIDYVRAILNMALWLLSLVALIMTIYTFYMMFFSENEAGVKKAKWNLVGIFIALGIIWLAWLIVSFIFWRYKEQWVKNQTNIPEDTISCNTDILINHIYL